MNYMQEIEEKKKLAARLHSSDPKVTLDILEKFVPHDLACLLVDKAFAASDDAEEHPYKVYDPKKTVPSLVELSAAIVGSDKNSVDTLYAIYGPDTNFPFPSWVGPKVEELSKVDDLESKFKLALLLSNNATTTFSFSSSYEDEETEVSKVLGPLLWKKLSSVCKKLQVVSATCTRDDEDYPEFCNPEFYHAELVLPAVLKLSSLRVLDVGQTAFLDADLQIIGASLPQLKSFEFEFDGRVTKTGVQALGQLKNLEELLFDPCNENLMNLEDNFLIIENFMSRCLGSLPWLKVLCSVVNEDDTVFEHVLPLMEKGRVLSLEHLQLRGFLKANYDDYEENSELMYPYLRNVRFLKFQGLDDENDLIENLVDAELEKVEKLIIEEGCEYRPVRFLLEGIGQTLSEIDIDDCNGAWNFLMVLEVLPVAKVVNISGKGYYSFDYLDHLQHVSPNLKKLSVFLKNNRLCRLPRGVLASLLALPNLKHLTLFQLFLSAEDCDEVALKIKSGALQLPNLSSLSCYCDWNTSALFLAVLCAFCPKLYSLDIEGGSGQLKMLLFVLSALFYPKIKLNCLLDW